MEEADPHPVLSPSISPRLRTAGQSSDRHGHGSEGPRPVLLLLLVLLATRWAQLSEGTSYLDFVDWHQDNPKIFAFDNRHYCDITMKRRGLTCRSCDPTHTFIHAPPSQLQDICSQRRPTSPQTCTTARHPSTSPHAGYCTALYWRTVNTGLQLATPRSTWPASGGCPYA